MNSSDLENNVSYANRFKIFPFNMDEIMYVTKRTCWPLNYRYHKAMKIIYDSCLFLNMNSESI